MENMNLIYAIVTIIGLSLIPLILRIWRWLKIKEFFQKKEELRLGLNFPERHDLTCYDEEFDFVGSGFCSQQWEISVRQKFCIIWSVVLSYLKSADLKVTGQFEERLNKLTNGRVDTKLAKTAISEFNPFFNIHKCYYNKTVREICANFRNILNQQRSRKSSTVAQDLQMISSMLKTNILIVNLIEERLNVITPESASSGNVAHITLFLKNHITEQNNVQKTLKRFHFGLDESQCLELRKKALRVMLGTSEIKTMVEEEILPLLERGEKNINFLVTLLKKDAVLPVSHLYDSSFIARKLSDAGFETDPRVLDPYGFSAFYYALQSNDSNLVYILYRYAANSCYEFKNTFRDPNPWIISNLSKLKQILNEDCARSTYFEKCGDRAEQARLNYQDLQRFNEYLTQISDGINGIRKKCRRRPLTYICNILIKSLNFFINYLYTHVLLVGYQYFAPSHRTPIAATVRKLSEGNSKEEAAKQKDVILHILDTYVSEQFFCVGQIELELFENYIKHKTYYDNVDLTAAILFFDNIFLLKNVLKSPRPCLYSELESSFLLSAITNKYFTKKTIKDKIHDLGFGSDSTSLPIIPLLERLNLRKNIKKFCSILREKKLGEDDIIERIPRQEITEMLSKFPELKDEFLVFRLNHYLKAALETESERLKQKLVIQRALQVIGESINVEKEAASSIRHQLYKCLPEDTVTVLKKVRNTLSHLESYQFPLKFETEQDDDLFRSIQSEIKIIKEAFEAAFEIHRVRFKEFLFNRGLENINQYEGSVPSVENLKEEMLRKRKAQKEKSIELECTFERKKTDGQDGSVPSIKEFCRRLTVEDERSRYEQLIRRKIPQEVTNRVDAIKELEQHLQKGIVVDLDRFNHLFLNNKRLRKVKEDYQKYLEEKAEPGISSKRSSLLDKIRKAPNPSNILESIFKKMTVSKSQFNFLLEKMCFSQEAKDALNSLMKNSEIPCGDNLANLLNRIKHLYQISIEEQDDIRYLWGKVRSVRAKQFLIYLIVQRYFRDSSFQAALEMLLFDCFAILKYNREKNKVERNRNERSDEEINNEDPFWLKSSYLFNGIDVRNVLAHGDPLVESIGPILDPKDFPSELVKKMLQLFQDRECIEALWDLQQKMKEIPENCTDCQKLRERIVRCGHWQGYCKLLEDTKDSQTSESIISFLKKPF